MEYTGFSLKWSDIYRIKTHVSISLFHYSKHYRKLALCRLQFSLPTVFFRHSAKRSLCQLEFPAVGKAGFADCLTLPTARQLAKPWICRLPGSWQRIAVGKGRPWLTPSTPSPLPTATPSAVGKGAGFANCHPPWQSAKNFYFF